MRVSVEVSRVTMPADIMPWPYGLLQKKKNKTNTWPCGMWFFVKFNSRPRRGPKYSVADRPRAHF